MIWRRPGSAGGHWPEARNALNADMRERTLAALSRCGEDPDIRAVVLTGTGKGFCTGADLSGSRAATGTAAAPHPGGTRDAMRPSQRLIRALWDLEKPIVAAHHAACVGGGLEMSLSCDFRLAAKSARYSFPESKMGVLPASNGVSRLTRIVGTHWARWLIMANMIVDADKALIMGRALCEWIGWRQ